MVRMLGLITLRSPECQHCEKEAQAVALICHAEYVRLTSLISAWYAPYIVPGR